ncbi:MAG: hypothetical protein ACRDJY_02150 [Thermoleophilaceae bacterium]
MTGRDAHFELNLVRHRGRLHIGVRETESPLTYRMIHRSISAGGQVGPSHTVAQGFQYLGYYPAFYTGFGSLLMNFGAKVDGDGYSNSHMMQAISADNGETWGAPTDSQVTDGPGKSPSEMDGTTVTTGGWYFVWEGTLCICVQRDNVPDSDHTNFNDTGGNNIDPSIGFDSASGKVWVVYLIFGGENPGLYVREVDTTTAEPAGGSILLPGSFNTFEGERLISFQNGHVPMAARSQGGLFVAYRNGYPSTNRVRLWRVGAPGFTTVASGTAIGEVAIAADPNGRMWAVWASRSRIFGRRSNESVSQWGKTVSVADPRGSVGIATLQADAQARVVDVLAASQRVENPGSFHTQLEPGITFDASPRRFRGAVRVRFETKDAGDPLANTRITVAGESCTTNSNGVCSIPLGPYDERKRLRAKAERSDFTPAKLTLRARPPRR